MASVREKIVSFIVSPKDVPLLAGFSIGLYLVVFIYARNLFFTTSFFGKKQSPDLMGDIDIEENKDAEDNK